jgi:hypothetical protein
VANQRASVDYSRVLWADGKPYWLKADGSKSFIPPATAGQLNDPRAKQWAASMGYKQDTGGQVLQNDVFDGREASFAKNRGHWDPDSGDIKQDTDWTNIVTTGLASVPLAAGALSAAGVGAGGGASPAASASPGLHTAVPNTAAMGSQGVSQGASKMGFLDTIKKWALGGAGGGGGLDPTMMILGALSMLGGDGGPNSFKGTGADPVKAMEAQLSDIRSLGQGLQNRGPAKLSRRSVVQPGPEPVNIPGLNFQIGGGLGKDLALEDPTLLEGPDTQFDGLFGAGTQGPAQPRQVRQRDPNNG